MPYSGINWIAIVGAAIIPMIVGMLWYSPAMFAKKWLALIGKTEEEIKKMGSPAKAYSYSFIASLIMSYVLNYFVGYTSSDTFILGTKIGFATWLGFVVTTSSAGHLYEGRPFGLYALNAGYNLVCLLLMGGLLAVWR